MGRHPDYTDDWPVPARWPADCPECHQPWQPGTPIVRDGGRWVHHQCPPREDIEPGTPGEPYPRWFCRATWEHLNVPAVDLAADTPDTIRAAS